MSEEKKSPQFLIHAFYSADGITTEWRLHGSENQLRSLFQQLITENETIKDIITTVINNQNNNKNV